MSNVQLFTLVFLLANLIPNVVCQDYGSNNGPDPACQFIVPSENFQDLQQKFTVGQTVPVSWIGDTAWNGSLADLWITWDLSNDFTDVYQENIDMRLDGSYSWDVQLNSSLLATDNRFVLRLKPHLGDPPSYSADNGTWGIYSRGFIVTEGSASRGSSSAVSSTTTSPTISSSHAGTSTSTAAATSTTASSSPTPTPIPAGGLSTGAKAGIGIAAAVGAILLFAAGFWLSRRSGTRTRGGTHAGSEESDSKKKLYNPGVYEMNRASPTKGDPIYEIGHDGMRPSNTRHELHG